MNAVEIEEAVSELAKCEFDRNEFPYQFLLAFGKKNTTIKKLRSGSSNQSDLNGVLQRNNIHILTCLGGEVDKTLEYLRESSATKNYKVKFVLATDGKSFIAEEIGSGEIITCEYKDFANHFGFFLPLAGISTVKTIRENSFDIRATSRLNKLYVELIKTNPDWGKEIKKDDMNHFMTRLIFCFFAEDTEIFGHGVSFTKTIEELSERDSSNTHFVISEIFRAMDIKKIERETSKLPRWANVFPYVNGGLFSKNFEVPIFSKIARSYLIHIGNLDWTKINPDIFGSMIQAVAEEEERGFLGMHYTSVPNILKLLNPLFLDDLRTQLKNSKNNERKLLNLRKRISKIRVFDPACGSGNFLVIAYKELRKIENDINELRREFGRKSEIPLTNFRGVEIRSFASEIARLALIISEYQCNVNYLGQKEAILEFLPLDTQNWITCGNSLKLDWNLLCPNSDREVKLYSDDLFSTPIEQTEIDFKNTGGEVYVCGNPPYKGSQYQAKDQKDDLKFVFEGKTKKWKSIDYVSGWFMKAAVFCYENKSEAAFVATNSICQGRQVGTLWELIFETKTQISFAHTGFKWSNLASHNAGVTVVIVGLSTRPKNNRLLFYNNEIGETIVKNCNNINPYLISGPNIVVQQKAKPPLSFNEMRFGNMPADGGHLLLSFDEVKNLEFPPSTYKKFIRRIYGSSEFIRGIPRFCLWIEDKNLEEAKGIEPIKKRIDMVYEVRQKSKDQGTRNLADRPHQMRELNIGKKYTIIVPSTSSHNRQYLPCGLIDKNSTVTNAAFAIFDAPLWSISLIGSRMHRVWISTVCGRLGISYRYSNTLGWNTFPIPKLTQKNIEDLNKNTEEILITREMYFPKTIAELYEPEKMPETLLDIHKYNDEVLERIYIGRSFKNDTERIEKLFELYCKALENN